MVSSDLKLSDFEYEINIIYVCLRLFTCNVVLIIEYMALLLILHTYLSDLKKKSMGVIKMNSSLKKNNSLKVP